MVHIMLVFPNYLIILPVFEITMRPMKTTDYQLYLGLNLPILNIVSMFWETYNWEINTENCNRKKYCLEDWT